MRNKVHNLKGLIGAHCKAPQTPVTMLQQSRRENHSMIAKEGLEAQSATPETIDDPTKSSFQGDSGSVWLFVAHKHVLLQPFFVRFQDSLPRVARFFLLLAEVFPHFLYCHAAYRNESPTPHFL
jgi:hypothetical protein